MVVMLSEVVYNHHIKSPTTSLPAALTGVVSSSEVDQLPINQHFSHINFNSHNHYAAPPCSAVVSASTHMASDHPSCSGSGSTDQLGAQYHHQPQSHHNPVLAATGPSMSLPASTGASSAGAVLMSMAKPKRSKLRPHLSLRIALSSSQQSSGSPMSPTNGFHGSPAGCSFDGCLPLSPSLQQQLLQKSEPLLSASAIDELQPVEILPKLYIGTMKSASDRGLLERLNIGYVINVTTNLPNFFEDRYPLSFKYLRIPLEDHWSGEISQYIDEAIAFINNARRSDQACLVHCLAGRSRSVAIVLAYIMCTFACTLDEAYDLVKSRKPGVAPGLHFLRQLHDFEKRFVPSKKVSDEVRNSTSGSSGEACSDESSGCSTPSTSMSFDPAESSAAVTSTASVTSTNVIASATPTPVSASSTGNVASFHLPQSGRTICPSLPSIDSAFTEEQTPPAPTSSQCFTMFSTDESFRS